MKTGTVDGGSSEARQRRAAGASELRLEHGPARSGSPASLVNRRGLHRNRLHRHVYRRSSAEPSRRWGNHAWCDDRRSCSGWSAGGETPCCAEQDSGPRRTEQRSPPGRRRHIARTIESEKRLRGLCSRRLTRLSRPEGGSTLPSRRNVSSISDCMLIAKFLPAPARLRARVAHGIAGSGWSIRLS